MPPKDEEEEDAGKSAKKDKDPINKKEERTPSTRRRTRTPSTTRRTRTPSTRRRKGPHQQEEGQGPHQQQEGQGPRQQEGGKDPINKKKDKDPINSKKDKDPVNKKKKWSKGIVRDKLDKLVLFNKMAYNKLCKEVPNYKLVSAAIVSERLKIRGSLARATLWELLSKGLIRLVSEPRAQVGITVRTFCLEGSRTDASN
ncbi:UNVERIFIED_CONTAM: hypothetical protein K2H54_015156 [Gekko kuhli]